MVKVIKSFFKSIFDKSSLEPSLVVTEFENETSIITQALPETFSVEQENNTETTEEEERIRKERSRMRHLGF